eukprot:GFUD01012335.1.p1 GENE.GFUD01012335.1~~GFUD01012335.1.p1  ORF type:complete len:160 (+),score=37.88 GFUD01012335.1:51-530(+)
MSVLKFNVSDQSFDLGKLRDAEFKAAIEASPFDFKKNMKAYRDPSYDYDFTYLTPTSVENYERGGKPYFWPYGWKRYAVKVKGKFEDDTWLGSAPSSDARIPSDAGEWWVAYHGTKDTQNMTRIAKKGLTKMERQAYGPGIYSTPNVDVASLYGSCIIH